MNLRPPGVVEPPVCFPCALLDCEHCQNGHACWCCVPAAHQLDSGCNAYWEYDVEFVVHCDLPARHATAHRSRVASDHPAVITWPRTPGST